MHPPARRGRQSVPAGNALLSDEPPRGHCRHRALPEDRCAAEDGSEATHPARALRGTRHRTAESAMTAAPFWDAPQQAAAELLIAAALQEDLADAGDITSAALIPPEDQGRVRIVARQSGRLCGVVIGRQILEHVDPHANWTAERNDGDMLDPDVVVATLSGRVRSLLTAERTILNFMTHLSGVATLTARFVEAIRGTRAVVLDTRKTLPGWRHLQKYAVRCGGGTNHRIGLWDAVLIKDNHLAALAEEGITSLAEVVQVARTRAPSGVPVIIEVDTLSQLQDALQGGPDIVLLDNM